MPHGIRHIGEVDVQPGPREGRSAETPAARTTVLVQAADDEAPPEDAQLLERCRDGDSAAWDALVRRYERLVFSVALRNGLSREDAADVAQTTFLALLRSIS